MTPQLLHSLFAHFAHILFHTLDVLLIIGIGTIVALRGISAWLDMRRNSLWSDPEGYRKSRTNIRK